MNKSHHVELLDPTIKAELTDDWVEALQQGGITKTGHRIRWETMFYHPQGHIVDPETGLSLNENLNSTYVKEHFDAALVKVHEALKKDGWMVCHYSDAGIGEISWTPTEAEPADALQQDGTRSTGHRMRLEPASHPEGDTIIDPKTGLSLNDSLASGFMFCAGISLKEIDL